MREQGGPARWWGAALLRWFFLFRLLDTEDFGGAPSFSVCCLYSFVVDVGDISVVSCASATISRARLC